MSEMEVLDSSLSNGIEKEDGTEKNISVREINVQIIDEAKLKFDNIISEYFNRKLSQEEKNLILDFQQYTTSRILSTIGEVQPKKEVIITEKKTKIPNNNINLKKKKRKRPLSKTLFDTDELLYSSDSLLNTVELKKIVNNEIFNDMIPDTVKDQLLPLLPNCDVISQESIQKMFESREFLASLELYLRHLDAGTFDVKIPNQRAKKKKDCFSWKEQYFENYWGQRTMKELLLTEPPLSNPQFRYSKPSLNPSVLKSARRDTNKNNNNNNNNNNNIANVKKVQFNMSHIISNADSDEDSDQEYTEKKTRKKSNQNTTANHNSNNINHSNNSNKKNNNNGGTKKGKVSFRSMALEVLQRVGHPLQPKEIISISLKEDNFVTYGKTPENTLASVLYKEIQQKNPPSPFIKMNTKPTTFGLREWQQDEDELI